MPKLQTPPTASLAPLATPANSQTFPLQGQQQGPTIDDIRVEGTQRIEASTVIAYLTLKKGDSFSQESADKSIKSLSASGLFSDVQLSMSGDVLIAKVAENPIVNQITFEGNHEVEEADLRKELQLKPRSVYTKTKLQADVDRLLDVYRKSGRFGAVIDPKLIKLEQNRVNIVFEIKEGDRTGVTSIRFLGNKAFDDGELREQIATRQTRWWRFFSNADFYDPDRMNYDRELLRRFYLDHGYADYRVLSAVAELSPEQNDFFITFTMEEGARYKFGKINIKSEIKEIDPASLTEFLTTHQDEWYSASAVEKSIAVLTNKLGDQQYAFVQIVPDVHRDKDAHTIDVTYDIKEGPRVFIEKINIAGNDRTLDKVIRRQLLLAEGDPFSLSKLKLSEQRIKDLGFFEDTKVTPQQGSEPDLSVLNVTVKEKATGDVSVGAGYSSTDGALADFGIRERNLLGTGQDLRFDAMVSQLSQSYDASFTDPYFLDRDLAAGVDLFRTTNDDQQYSSYDEKDTGISFHLGYPLSERLRQKLNYTFSDIDIEDVPSTSSLYIQQQQGVTYTSLIGQELLYDARNSKLTPTDGYYIKLNNDFAGLGGNVDFLRNRLGGAYYHTLFDEDVILNLVGEGGYIIPLEGQALRINDRFFLGGQSLRGFEYAGVGPRDLTNGENDSLGGDWFARSSAQVDFPIGLPKELGVTGHTFVDAGTLSQLDGSFPPGEVIVDDASLRLSVGVGISWQSPFGPIQVDLGFPILKKDYDQLQQFSFNFGTRFQ